MSRREPRGFALIIVLLVLASLVAVATPFLLSMRAGDRVAVHRTAQARARLAAQGGIEHARRFLHDTYPSRDASPLSDGAAELAVPPIPKEVLDARDPRGTILSVRAEDEQGKIHLNSAPPALLAALFGGRAFLARDVKADDAELFLDDASGLPEEGIVWLGNELVHYTGKAAGKLTGCTRGVLAGDGRYAKARDHASGALVLDDRARAIALHRIGETSDGRWHPFDSPSGVAGLEGASPAEPYTRRDFERIASFVTVWSDRLGAGDWTAPVRIHEFQKDADEVYRVLRTGNAHDFPAGATVRIASGKSVFHALVLESNPSDGRVVLEEGLPTVPDPFRATISALVRHPVNANSASPEVLRLCLEGLRRRAGGSSESVSASEARALADRIVAARAERPIAGFEDFVHRVLEPAGVAGAIAETDVETVLRNAENANDAWLLLSTVPFTFASGDVYAIESAASINARSGVERARLSVREIRAVRPQEELFLALGTQVAFDDHLRLSRAARHWCTGPSNTSMWDSKQNPAHPDVPPSRAIPFLGLAGLETQAFPSEVPEESWLQLWPARRFEIGPYLNRVEHFDYDRDPEGRDPRKKPALHPAVGNPVALADPRGVLFPGSMEGWFKFDGAPANGSILLDLGADATERNRISLLVEGPDLVLRAYDAGGEDSFTPDRDAAEVHLPTAGLAPNTTWHHLLASFRGTRPSDLLLQVDGVRRTGTVTHGLTRLASRISAEDTVIPVESTKGFPASGTFVVRIGGDENAPGTGELAEVRVDGHTLAATWSAQGNATQNYAGGRGARAFLPASGAGIPAAYDPVGSTARIHERGEKVELCGYAATLASNLPLGGARLAEKVGRFTVAYVKTATPPDTFSGTADGGSLTWGTGIYKNATQWELEPVDASETSTFMDAFQQNGGYALVFQFKHFPGSTNPRFLTSDQHPVFAPELIRYGGKSGKKLNVPATGRGKVAALFPGQNQGFIGTAGQQHAFVLQGTGWYFTNYPAPPANMWSDAKWRIYVVPLSIPGDGAVNASGTAYLVPPAGATGTARSEYVQIYDRTNEALTEWVRYDEILESAFVRTRPTGTRSLRAMIDASPALPVTNVVPNPPTPGQPNILEVSALLPPPAPPSPPPSQSSAAYQIGTDETASAVKDMARALGMRGVHGTSTHAQAAGADLIPVFRTSFGSGHPGRHDRVAVLEPGVGGSPARYTVNWAALNDETDGTVLVAFKEQTGNLFAMTTNLQGNAVYESRNYARLLKSPSGELPTTALRFAAGGSFDGAGGTLNGVVDEVAFTTATAPGDPYDVFSLGRFILANTGGLDETERSLRLHTSQVIFPHGVFTLPNGANPLDKLPLDAGVLQVDEELMVYRLVTPGSGEVTIEPTSTGRAALASEKSRHGQGTSVVFLDHWVASRLAGGASPSASTLSLVDPAGFPPEGTARLGDELVHWTRLRGDNLEMPRRSEEPGADDEKGGGLFRGRFGTTPANHPANEVVLLWPFRFWDRYRPMADAPELSFYQAEVRAEDAFYRRIFWEEEIPASGLDVVALARVDEAVPWDADPEKEKDLRLFKDPKEQGLPVELGRRGSRLEVRFFTEYLPGAFDPIQGLADGWRSAPRIRTIVLDYLAPERLLRREETDG
ncbi:MAG TPA: hypothetical protein VFI25_16190 [Planctomycetota bacterium]|jgi:hypothetical protein|nr:hypothetical protein [Planctomycetota bacterium]